MTKSPKKQILRKRALLSSTQLSTALYFATKDTKKKHIKKQNYIKQKLSEKKVKNIYIQRTVIFIC